jgi:hypothetical protein
MASNAAVVVGDGVSAIGVGHINLNQHQVWSVIQGQRLDVLINQQNIVVRRQKRRQGCQPQWWKQRILDGPPKWRTSLSKGRQDEFDLQLLTRLTQLQAFRSARRKLYRHMADSAGAQKLVFQGVTQRQLPFSAHRLADIDRGSVKTRRTGKSRGHRTPPAMPIVEPGPIWKVDFAQDRAHGKFKRPPKPDDQTAAVTYMIAFGPRAGQKVLTLRGAMPREDWARQPLCADIDGNSAACRGAGGSLRPQAAGAVVPLQHPPSWLSDERVQLSVAGQVELKLKTPWRDGTTRPVKSPLEFMQRVAALVTRPGLHLTGSLGSGQSSVTGAGRLHPFDRHQRRPCSAPLGTRTSRIPRPKRKQAPAGR